MRPSNQLVSPTPPCGFRVRVLNRSAYEKQDGSHWRAYQITAVDENSPRPGRLLVVKEKTWLVDCDIDGLANFNRLRAALSVAVSWKDAETYISLYFNRFMCSPDTVIPFGQCVIRPKHVSFFRYLYTNGREPFYEWLYRHAANQGSVYRLPAISRTAHFMVRLAADLSCQADAGCGIDPEQRHEHRRSFVAMANRCYESVGLPKNPNLFHHDDPLGLSILNSIKESPEDKGSWSAYADHLMENGPGFRSKSARTVGGLNFVEHGRRMARWLRWNHPGSQS